MRTRINKKILPNILVILTLFSVTQSIFATSGSGQWVGGQYASGYTTTESNNGGNGILIKRLINYTTGEARTVFCSEYRTDFKTGVIYNGSYYTPTDTSIKNACKIACFGWYSKYGDYVVYGGIPEERKKDYAFTQQMIWETLG